MKKVLKNDKIFNFFIFPLIVLLLMDIFYKANGIVLNGFTNYAYIDCFISIFKFPIPFLISFITIFSLNVILMTIFNNSKISKIVLTTVVLILMIVNDFKFVIMDLPIRISDISYLNASNGEMMVSFFDSVKGSWILKTIFKTIGVIIVLIVLIKTDGKIHTKFKKGKIRLLVGISCLLLLALIWYPNEKLQLFYLENFYPNKKDVETTNDSDIVKTYYKYGFLEGVYYFYLKDNVISLDEYSKKEVKKLLNSFNEEDNQSWGQPNVVVILSETLSDASKLEGIEFDKELLKNIKSYDENPNTEYLNIFSPAYGGASVNTEFEILTGANLSFFNAGYIPYTQLYNDKNGSHLPNLIKEFNNNNYTTKYITAWGPDSYKSSYVYSKFGVDEKIYNQDLINPVKKGAYISDAYMMDVIVDELIDKKEDERKFLFVATGQNHSPYSIDRYDKYDIEVTKTDYNKEDTGLLKCYAQGVYDADKEIARLYKEILKLNEPTIVVLYGDHLPFIINSNGENIYLNDPYFSTDDENLNTLRKHTTPAVILANYDIEIGDLDFINLNYLGSYILNNVNLKIDNYFKYVNSNIKDFPVYNRTFIYNGKFQAIDDLSYRKQKQFQEIEQVQYHKFFDYDEKNN